MIVLVESVVFFYLSKQLYSESYQQRAQISNLISEIGELKAENENLSVLFNSQQNALKAAEILLKVQNQQIEEITGNQSAFSTQANSLNSIITENQLAFQNQLAQKNQEIDLLKEKNALSQKFQQYSSQNPTFLALGINEGLTDSIQLITINHEKKQITVIGIPRDLQIAGRKINEYYSKFGIESLKQQLNEITGLTINKSTIVNQQAFIDFINLIGGISINIDKKLVDDRYPTPNFGYKTVTFETGLQQLDGEKALEYARSRKSTTDFDRILRQQKIMIAIKDQVIQNNLLADLDKLKSTFEIGLKNIQTDLNFFDLISLYNLSKDYTIKIGNILDHSNHLYSTNNKAGQYILLPKNGNFIEIQKQILNII